MRRQLVGSAARRGGDDEPVPDEVAQALDTVDGHPDVDRLSGLSGDGDLVERPSLHHLWPDVVTGRMVSGCTSIRVAARGPTSLVRHL